MSAPPLVLDGKALARTIRAEVAEGVAELIASGGRRPGLAAVLVGEDPASRIYVGSKARASEEAGFLGEVHELPAAASQAQLLAAVESLNARDEIDGILVQLPLPEGLDETPAIAAIDPARDVDGIHPESVGRLWLDLPGLAPATPSGVVELLRRSGIEMAGRSAVIVGRSQLVGKPLAALLLRQNATVTLCHSRTADLAAVCRGADILVAAVGRAGLIGPDHVKPGAVVIDVGINRVSDRKTVERLFPGDAQRLERFERRGSTVVGDVDFARVAPLASAITPVPGGVGPLTVAMLLANTLAASRHRQGEGAA